MNKIAVLTFIALEEECYILNQALLTKDDLILFIALHDYDYDNKERSKIDFDQLALECLNEILNELGSEEFTESIKWFNRNDKGLIRLEIEKRTALLNILDRN